MRKRLLMIGWALSGSLGLASMAVPAEGSRFEARLHQSVWHLQAAPASCELSHEIPEYGHARFTRRPGQDRVFSVDLPIEATLAESAVVRAVPPAWKHDAVEHDLSRYPMPLTARTLELSADDSQQVYATLERGMFVEIAYRPGTDMVVVLSAVRFLEVADAFRECETSLTRPAVVTIKPHAATARAAKRGSSGKSRSLGTPAPPSESMIPTDMAIADATVRFEGPDDTFSEVVLITLTGIAREYVLQKRNAALQVTISGIAESEEVYQKRASRVKTYLTSQGLPADKVRILDRGASPQGKNVQPEAPSPDVLHVHLLR